MFFCFFLGVGNNTIKKHKTYREGGEELAILHSKVSQEFTGFKLPNGSSMILEFKFKTT